MYEGEVTEITPEYTAEATGAAAGAYGKTVAYVLIGLRTAKVGPSQVALLGWLEPRHGGEGGRNDPLFAMWVTCRKRWSRWIFSLWESASGIL